MKEDDGGGGSRDPGGRPGSSCWATKPSMIALESNFQQRERKCGKIRPSPDSVSTLRSAKGDRSSVAAM
jgi:hypothetical protein